MSNIAGKAYAMNVITPIRSYLLRVNKLIFWLVPRVPGVLDGLITLSLIHYAHWILIGKNQFPHVDPKQPKEDLKYCYMMFFTNFNGSWDQYVDSFTFAIPFGLDLLWKWNVRYPKSVSLTPFHNYIRYNQIETIHYYNGYPLAASNDVKSAKAVKNALIKFQQDAKDASDDNFMKLYNGLLRGLQHDLGDMYPPPIISMSAHQVQRREMWHKGNLQQGG